MCGSALFVSGALDPTSVEAGCYAKQAYESIRKDQYDVSRIARNTRIDEKTIFKIKSYLFIDEHDLIGGKRRFDPSFVIAQSWQRLSSNHPDEILDHDLALLSHELYEIELVEQGIDHIKAHYKANRFCNYQEASDSYYADLKRKGKLRKGLAALREERKKSTFVPPKP